MAGSIKENAKQQMPRQPSPELFMQTISAYLKIEALKAAIQLDIFTVIGDGEDVGEISRRCNASTRGIRILCDYLVSTGFLQKDDNKYALTNDSKAFLDKRSPYFMGGMIEFFFSPTNTEAFRDLPSVVRKGTTLLESGGLVAPDHPEWVTFARTMAPLMKMPAVLLASMLGADETASWKILDVAAGHGLFGIEVAKRYPNAKVVALDWQNVLSVARENALSEGISDRYSLLPGDAFEVEMGANYDVVLVPNFLHHFDLGGIETFLSRVFKALKPGGKVVILEGVVNEDRISPPDVVQFSVVMLATTKSGNVYTFSEYQKVLGRIGFSNIETQPIPPTTFQAILAKK